jgi:hypothetical protein
LNYDHYDLDFTSDRKFVAVVAKAGVSVGVYRTDLGVLAKQFRLPTLKFDSTEWNANNDRLIVYKTRDRCYDF